MTQKDKFLSRQGDLLNLHTNNYEYTELFSVLYVMLQMLDH